MKRKGEVRWFDRSSGHGVIRDIETDESIRVYACNIIGSKSWFEHLACMYLEDGALVEFEHSDCGANKVTNGVFDQDQWDRIKNNNHSFTENAQGEFGGLFKKEKI